MALGRVVNQNIMDIGIEGAGKQMFEHTVYFFRKKRIAAVNNDGENGRMIIDSLRMNNSLPLGTNRGGGVDNFSENHLVFRGTEGESVVADRI